MELTEVIKKRRSIRKFKSDPVPEATVDELLEAARLAPSASNLQPWRFVLVRSEAVKKQLGETTPYRFAFTAPLIFVCCADISASGAKPERIKELIDTGAFTGVEMSGTAPDKYPNSPGEVFSPGGYLAVNVAIAVEHMVLKAMDLGLGSCWIGRFDTKKTRAILGLEAEIQPVVLLPVGYPDQAPGPRPRLSRADILLKTL